MKEEETLFHALSAEETLEKLETSEEGLNDAQVEERRKEHGWNEIPETARASWLLLLLKQFKSLLVIILLIAAAIAWFVGHTVDMWVILAVVLVNAIIGFIQEYRAENAAAALKKMIVQRARVLRNGEARTVAAKELVPGDIIVLEEGESIPADARIVEEKNLRTIEAALTGESVPTAKNIEPVDKETGVADRKNMLFKGTFVAGGYAKAAVTGTGVNTALGDIATMLTGIKPQKTNFQKKSDKLAKHMGFLAIGSAAALFAVGYFTGNYEFNELLLVSIAALVSAIPEGLPAVLTIVLAIGSWRMAKRNAIIREITSVETLGAVTAIITDKTGTLTQNSLTVKKVSLGSGEELDIEGEGWAPMGNFRKGNSVVEPEEHPLLQKLLQIAGISNNSDLQHDQEADTYELVGDPTEGALLVLARKGGLQPRKAAKGKKVDDLPFNSKQKYRATLYLPDDSDTPEILVVGAPEKILELSTHILTDKGEKRLDEETADTLRQKTEEWSGRAMRVIGLAYKKADKEAKKLEEEDVGDLVFAGITGMIDPPRLDARVAVEKCRTAGIRVIMATGDHISTAIAIARETAIIDDDSANPQVQAMTENQLAKLDDSEFDKAINSINVFARLTPAMKLRIAERLQEQGELVAMTGDGVNDAPALKKADIGIAMGIMGTDVARSASSVVLADDNFATIVNAVEEGRIVFTNARQTSFFLVTTNVTEIAILIILVALGQPIPLTATQILWLNLVTDGLGDKALATEQGHGDELEHKPISQRENILNKGVLPFLLIVAATMATLSLLVYFYYLDGNIEKTRTMVFIAMAFCQLYNVLNMRSLKKSMFEVGFFSNKWINWALALSVVIQVIIIEVPFFQRIFRFEYVTPVEFIVVALLASVVLWAGEAYKLIKKKLKRA